MEKLCGFVNDFGKKQKKKLEKGCTWEKTVNIFLFALLGAKYMSALAEFNVHREKYV